MRTPVRWGARLFALLVFTASPAEAQRAEWTTPIDASFRLFAALRPLTADAAGNVFAVGYGPDGTTSNIVTVKLMPDGREAWRATLSSSASSTARAITTDPFGNVYVAASVAHAGLAGADYLVVKYDPDGNELWRRSANASPFMFASPSAITADPIGNVYVTGGSNGGSAAQGDFFTLKYAPNGTEVWRAVTDGGSNLGDAANGIALDDAGNSYVVGASVYNYDPYEGSFSTARIVKYDSLGALQWRTGIPGNGLVGTGVAVATDAMGSALVAATSTTGLYPYFPVPYLQLAKFDPEGGLLWSVDATGPAGLTGEGSRAHALAVDTVGNAYVTGEYWDVLGINTRTTFMTLKYNPSGAEQWRAIDSANLPPYGSFGNFAQGLVLNSHDDVVVTGQRAFDGPGTTMKLGAAGTVDWTLAQPAFLPAAIARGPADSVYVAGATAMGIVIQKIVDEPLSAPVATMVPTTSHGALVLLSVVLVILAASGAAMRRGSTRKSK